MELVQEKVLDALSACAEEGAVPEIARKVGQLLRQGKDHHFERQAGGKVRVVLVVLYELHQILRL